MTRHTSFNETSLRSWGIKDFGGLLIGFEFKGVCGVRKHGGLF